MSDRRTPSINLDAILEQTPNGVLLTDAETRIQYVNPAFREIFGCRDIDLIGKKAGEFVHCDCFEQVIAAGDRMLVKESFPEVSLSFRGGLFPIEGEGLFCGIFSDTSAEEEARRSFRELRSQTIERAREVIERQMKTAQEIARLLGETTAETKVLLQKLMTLFEEEG